MGTGEEIEEVVEVRFHTDAHLTYSIKADGIDASRGHDPAHVTEALTSAVAGSAKNVEGMLGLKAPTGDRHSRRRNGGGLGIGTG
jgi:hypothetical protein